jgi:magnesium-transporting ATPase (P-type)
MATQALRVLAFAQVDDDALDGLPASTRWPGARGCWGWSARSTRRATRSSVSVADCRAAGIRPIMVTG